MPKSCSKCHFMYPDRQTYCPHCARPMLYPNVEAAEEEEERAALAEMYAGALEWAAAHDVIDVLRLFEAQLASSHAVIARPAGEVQRIATSDREVYATYYQLSDAEIRIPEGNRWDRLRRVTDEVLFQGYREGIRFGALSLNERGLTNYGSCMLILREDLIAHRATVFVENTVQWMKRYLSLLAEDGKLPCGFRALWESRAQLSVVKYYDRLTPTMEPRSFPALLLSEGADSAGDDFMEVHIYGPITVRALRKVVVQKPAEASALIKLEALAELLGQHGVPLEVVS